jgi:hypothetical protein
MRGLIAITASSGSGGGSGTGAGGSGTGGAPVPLWRRPAVLAAGTAVAVTVIGGWIQQGGAAAVASLFGEDDNAEPVIHAKTMEPDFCGVWHLNKKASVVSDELIENLTGPQSPKIGDPDYAKTLSSVRKATGSDLPSGNTVQVTIEGSNEKAAILNSLDVDVQKRSALSGDLMLLGSGCGGGLAQRRYVTELGDPYPRFKVVESSDSGEEVTKPIDFPYKVSSNDPEVFILNGVSKSQIVEWKATLHWTSGGKENSTEISDNGKPFVSFPVTPASYSFSTDHKKLIRLP